MSPSFSLDESSRAHRPLHQTEDLAAVPGMAEAQVHHPHEDKAHDLQNGMIGTDHTLYPDHVLLFGHGHQYRIEVARKWTRDTAGVGARATAATGTVVEAAALGGVGVKIIIKSARRLVNPCLSSFSLKIRRLMPEICCGQLASPANYSNNPRSLFLKTHQETNPFSLLFNGQATYLLYLQIDYNVLKYCQAPLRPGFWAY